MADKQDTGVELHGQFNIRQFAELLNLDPTDTTRLANFIRKHKTGQRPTYQEVGAAARAFVGLVDADQEITNKAAIMLKRVDAEPKMEESAMMEKAPPGFDPDLEKKLLKQYADNPERAYATMWTIHNKKNESVNEGIRVAKEGIEECWDDMGGQEMTQDGNGEQMSVTISMPGKNISVTTDSAEEIGSILRLAGINVDGVAPEAPAVEPTAPESDVVYVGAQTTPTGVPGDVDGDGDHDMADHKAEDDAEETKEATQTPSKWTDSQGNTHPATKVQGDRYGSQAKDSAEDDTDDMGNDRDEDVKEAKKPDADGDGVPDWADKKEGEDDNEAKNESAEILRLAGLTNEAEATSHDYIDYVNAKGDLPPDDLIDQPGVEWDPESGIISVRNATSLANTHRAIEQAGWQKHALAARRNPAGATQNKYAGDTAYQLESTDEAARILALAGVAEGKLMNSPAGTSMDEPKEFDRLPSHKGTAAGNKDYGLNRANGQGENPMSTHTTDVDESVEQAFEKAMGEYRKFVAENISRKK